MSLQPGSRFGAYEIQSVLGAGGMGEVYRARDTRLHRSVAIKVLRDGLAGDPERLARLRREAQLLASLNHPNIASIYGLEESDGAHALVLELVDGDTLATRIERGPLPVEEALSIAGQIAAALRAAHEAGIVHRDLKPANVTLREDGAVKVLDFGIAKTVTPRAGDDPSSSSPTLTALAPTAAGLLVGTPAYMAPEQVGGRSADRRCDIWAFGCVLFEMLTGRRAFPGRDVADTLAGVLTRDPDWSLLPAQVAPSIRALLRRCLVRDPRSRLGDLAAAQFVFEEQAMLTPSGVDGSSPSRPAPSRRLAATVGAVLLAAAASGGAVRYLTVRQVPPATAVRLALVTAPAAAPSFTDNPDQNIAVAPDGSWVTYVGSGATQLFIRPLDAIDSRVILTTPVYIRGVFVSDDGQWLGYVENFTTLRKVAVTGGAPATVVEMDGPSRGATWSSERGIVFATVSAESGLQRVDPAGGEVTVLTRPDAARNERDHVFPEFLPDHRHVLFTIVGGDRGTARVAVLDLDTGAWKTLVTGGYHGRYVSSGHLVYAAVQSTGPTLRAIAFDLSRLETRGTSLQVVSDLLDGPNGNAAFSVSQQGTLAYQSVPAGATAARSLVWVDRGGRETILEVPAGYFDRPRVSPDGSRLALSTGADLWLIDLGEPSAVPTRLTFAPGVDVAPVWTPDGRRLVFGSSRDSGAINQLDLYMQSADGGAVERLTESPVGPASPVSVTPDGGTVLINGGALVGLRLDSRAVETLTDTPFDAWNAEVSPDGRWLAYEGEQSDRPGQVEIYVRPFPNTGGGQWQVSTAGGTRPVWARNGEELFYLAPDGAMMAARVALEGARFSAQTPVRLFAGAYLRRASPLGRDFDVAPDGRFLMLKDQAADPSLLPPHIVVVQNFDHELKRLLP